MESFFLLYDVCPANILTTCILHMSHMCSTEVTFKYSLLLSCRRSWQPAYHMGTGCTIMHCSILPTKEENILKTQRSPVIEKGRPTRSMI